MNTCTHIRNEAAHVTVRLPAALHGKLKARAVDEGRLLTPNWRGRLRRISTACGLLRLGVDAGPNDQPRRITLELSDQPCTSSKTQSETGTT